MEVTKIEMKDIEGYEGQYAVTVDGRVWSYKRKKFLSPISAGIGYLQVKLYTDGKSRNCYIHRLVAEAYIPNPEGKPQVNHINENKTDNRLENLEWATPAENINHGTRNDRTSKAKSKPVYCEETDKIYSSQIFAALELGLNASSISKVCCGNRKTTGGYHFRYASLEEAALLS